jgi:hypothetical protein
MDKRCLYEQKTEIPVKVAERMEMTDVSNSLIEETELGKSILTLEEVLQTFED